MNIFFLDTDIKKCAEYHSDRHVIKMRVELAQLACSAHYFFPVCDIKEIPYKLTHKNHPSAIWVRESIQNYLYVVNLGLQLCNEMRIRFNTKDQKTENVLIWCIFNIPLLRDIQITVPKLGFDTSLSKKANNTISDAVENYRYYYYNNKKHLHKWTKTNIPTWIMS